MNTSSILLEQKRAELQVRLTILKENVSSLKNQLDSQTNLGSISEKFKNCSNLSEMRSMQKKALETEVQKELTTLDGLRVYCSNLQKEKENSESESDFYNKKISELSSQNEMLKKNLDELRQRRHLLQNEIDLLHNEHESHNQKKYAKEQIEKKSIEQQDFISNELSNNAKKIKLLQMKIDTLNQDIYNLDTNLRETKCNCDSLSMYNEEMTKKILTMEENNKEYDNKIYLIKREIDETKDYIDSSEKEKNKLNEQLDKLAGTIMKINQANIRINASLAIMLKSMEKKAGFMQKEEEYYYQCDKAKKKFVDDLKEVDSYKDLI